MKSYNVRKSTKNDYRELLPLVTASAIFQRKTLTKKRLDEPEICKEVADELKATMLLTYKGYFLAFDIQKELQAYIEYGLPMKGDHEFFINDIYVKPKFRHQKLAHSLLAKVVKLASSDKANKITLYVHENNLAAQSLYKKTGFKKSKDDYIRMELRTKR